MSSKDSAAARKLAALLFEFMMPGLRHPSFPKRASVQSNALVCTPLVRKARYQTTKKIVNRFRSGYTHDTFAQYVNAASSWTQCDFDWNRNLQGTSPIRCQTPPCAVSFEEILAELRISTALIQWLHRGNNQIWLGHAKHLPVTREFLLSCDNVRKRMLLDHEEHMETCLLTKLYIKDLGVDYEMRIGKLRHRLPWLCKQALLSKSSPQEEHAAGPMNLSLTRADAQYLVDLYDLKLKIN